MNPLGFVSIAFNENGFGPILMFVYDAKIVVHAPAVISWQEVTEVTGQEMGKEFWNKSSYELATFTVDPTGLYATGVGIKDFAVKA